MVTARELVHDVSGNRARDASLSILLLGPFQAAVDGQPVTNLASDKARALLAYLAVESGREHQRELLSSLLWPDSNTAHALGNLRQVLYRLRSTLAADEFLSCSRQIITFKRTIGCYLDVAEFEYMVDAAAHYRRTPLQADDTYILLLEQACALYRGEFLAGLTVPESIPYQEWAIVKQSALHDKAIGALSALATAHIRRGEYDRALTYTARMIELEPWSEEAHRQRMFVLMLCGQRTAALRQFEICRQFLSMELNTQPSQETETLYQEILDSDGTVSNIRPWLTGLSDADIIVTTGREQVPQMPQENTPVVATQRPLTGFGLELANLSRLLSCAHHGDGRAVLIAGMQGSGKTTLLTRFLADAIHAQPRHICGAASCLPSGAGQEDYGAIQQILLTLLGHNAGAMEQSVADLVLGRNRDTASFLRGCLLEQAPHLAHALLPCDMVTETPSPTAHTAHVNATRAARRDVDREQPASHSEPWPINTLFYEEFALFVRAAALAYPMLLVFDNLQWIDPQSMMVFFHLSLRLQGSRTLVIGLYRPEEIESDARRESHQLASIIGELGSRFDGVEIVLDHGDNSAFVDALIDAEPNDIGADFRDALYEVTSGHALFTHEMLMAAQRSGMLSQDIHGRWLQRREAAGFFASLHMLPSRVISVLDEQLRLVPADICCLLEAAAIQGINFDLDIASQVARCLYSSHDDPDDRMYRLACRLRHLIRHADQDPGAPGGMSRYRFIHPLLRQHILHKLDGGRRSHLEAIIHDLETSQPT